MRKSQFRWEFVNQVLMDVFYVSFVLTFDILYGPRWRRGATVPVAGWDHASMHLYDWASVSWPMPWR